MANIQINITDNGTTTLLTSGCICDRDIDVNVDVTTGGGGGYVPTDDELIYKGTCDYVFANDNSKWVIDQYGNRITTNNIDSANGMFSNYRGETIPFELNFTPKNSTYICDYMFASCSNLKELPVIRNLRLGAFTNRMFDACKNLRKITADKFPNVDFTYYQNYSYGQQGQMISGCYSLREIDKEILDGFMALDKRVSALTYSYWFEDCYALDELKDLYVVTGKAITSNMFSNFAADCWRLKTFTFETDDGVPKVAQWTNQTIDLSNSGIGYCNYNYSTSNLTGYNSGCTADDRVTDDTTYQALKDTENWWTTNIVYSRFNHDSAVATINSLPDTSAVSGGTNVIKFKGNSGSATDGGAINTLTEEEIAVATAKGWTVQIV